MMMNPEPWDPQAPSIWDLAEFSSLLNIPGVFDYNFDQCRLAAETAKLTQRLLETQRLQASLQHAVASGSQAAAGNVAAATPPLAAAPALTATTIIPLGLTSSFPLAFATATVTALRRVHDAGVVAVDDR